MCSRKDIDQVFTKSTSITHYSEYLPINPFPDYLPSWYNKSYVDFLMGLELKNGKKIVAIDNVHFYTRIKGRRGNPQVIADTLTNPVYTVEDEFSTKYVSIDATVVVTKNGVLKTFWYNNRHYRWAIYHGYRGECDIMVFCRRYLKLNKST